MRIQSIRAHNYVNLRAAVVDVPPEANALLISGPNGSGKTALLDSIRFLTTGELPRSLNYKKDLSSLITEGEADGWFGATLIDAEGRASEFKLNLKNGTGTTPLYGKDAPALAVSPQEFMRLEPNKRRRALFDIHGISLSQSAIAASLVKDGHDEARVNLIKTSLGAGFDAATKRAKELASESRGAWQATTGETYGAQKGESWRASVPKMTAIGDPDKITSQLSKKNALVVEAVRRRDEAFNDEQLHRTSGNTQKIAGELKAREAAAQSLAEQIDAAKEHAAAASAGGWTARCPCCNEMLKSERPGKLVKYDESAPVGPKAAAEAQAAAVQLEELRARHAAAQKKADEARAAKLMLERMPPRPSAEEVAQYEEEARQLLNEQRILEVELETAKAALSAEANAARATEDAARYHANVVAFNALAGAIEALPAKFMSDTLGAVNTALDTVSDAFGKRVVLGEDMELRYGTTPYKLLSESQQWRVELALGLALAARTGAMVLMDRFDIVQPSDRGAILGMLSSQDMAQVIIGATLKQAPAFPEGSGIVSHWLGDSSDD